ncbi:MAG: aldo/keto reductase [Polyangiaceae bacterium]
MTSLLEGCATPEGTRRFAARYAADKADDAYCELGATGLRVARLGFGGYRVDDRVEAHRLALEQALKAGVNLVDTSTNYTDGHSERLVGDVLKKLAQAKEIARDEVVVVTKIGYVQGENLTRAERAETEGRAFPEMVKVSPGLWHCLHPSWLDEQLERSRQRLGLQCIDVCLLHNPEYFLHDAASRQVPLADARGEFYRRLTEAFRWFEGAVQRGEIASYGVSSNTCVSAVNDRDATELTRMLEAATIASSNHGFRVLQLPFNLLEPAAALLANSGEPPQSVLEVARARQIGVLVNRPLNAITQQGLQRLARPDDLQIGVPLAAAMARLEALEQEFRTNLAPLLRSGPRTPPPTTLLDWSGQLSRLPQSKLTLAQWNDLESHVIGPRTAQVLAALDRGLSGAQGVNWPDLRERYLEGLGRVLQALRARAVAQSRADADAWSRRLDPALPADLRTAGLSQKALHVVASTPGVSTVLVGMRSVEWVDDAVATLRWPRLADTRAALRSMNS